MEERNNYLSAKQFLLKKKIIAALNESGLPICIEEYILKDIYCQVRSAADKQLEEELRNIQNNEEERV